MEIVTAEWLQSIEALKEVPLDQLQWMIDNSSGRLFQEGEYLFETGKPVTATYILVTGKFRLFFIQRNSIKEIATIESKAISGYLPFSRGLVANAMAMALAESQVMIF